MEQNTKKCLRVGMIGCGKITETRHAPECAAGELTEVAGFFDFVTARAAALAAQYGGTVFSSVEEMLASDKVDAVCVCTSNNTHAEISISAMRAGKHVLCEKPMATTTAECEAMLAAANETGRRLAIAHNQRLMPVHQAARALLADGAIGKPLSFKTCFGHSGPDNWSVDPGTGNWFFDRAKSPFGAIADLGIHKIDLIRFLLNDEICELNAMLRTLDKCGPDGTPVKVDDNAIILCGMASGTIGTVTASWTYYGAEDNATTIYGTEGYMEISVAEGTVTICRTGGERTVHTAPAAAMSGVIAEFADAVLAGRPSVLDATTVFPSMQAMLAALAASASGNRINP